ncbi:hypothetical protein [Nonlabens tegetincola]|uniref:hypothetical protein n=1 Tax=Nonlabens tegetincola TaxID=323273 RepID=UPI0030C8A522
MTKKLTPIFCLLLFLIVTSCTLESEFSLPNNEAIDSELLGLWSPTNNPKESVKIERHTDKRYKLTLIDGDDQEELIAYSTTIRERQILTIITEDEVGLSYQFYGISMTNNSLAYSEVNNQIREEKFESQQDLYDFFLTHIEKDYFFKNPETLKKISD